MPALINYENVGFALNSFKKNIPFDHCIVEDFFCQNVAVAIESEFMSYDDTGWFSYKNALEDKKALNDWNKFPSLTYKVFHELLSTRFVSLLENLLGCRVYPDHGLHGGGWHIHPTGGNLNPHLDYSIHPKMRLLRKLNLIVYLSNRLEESHGGHLGFWASNSTNDAPGTLVKEIRPKFNRAVLFDTTQNSWHGMSRPLVQPEGIFRKSIAVYYLVDPPNDTDQRQRALYAARPDQIGDSSIQELIKLRSDPKDYHKAYKKID